MAHSSLADKWSKDPAGSAQDISKAHAKSPVVAKTLFLLTRENQPEIEL
ncbi:hypothetical protein [Roseibium sediminis]|nr:hypothetical protein [Roseibium sediminis]